LLPLHCQEKDTTSNNDLYIKALWAAADQMEQSWGSLDDSVLNSRVRTNYRRLIVEKGDGITDDLPARLGEHAFEYLDVNGLQRRYHELKKEFAVLRINPMHNNGGLLTISISVYWFRAKKESVVYALSDWSKVTFRYDCKEQSWTLSEVKLGGI
jgi:hypothetical protein